ncbi:hypothetical protein GCM10009853_046300 [Glycomyces scopariae]
MSWREFIVALVDSVLNSLAWPLLILAVLLLFRKQIGAWGSALIAKDSGRLTIWGAELEFSQLMKEIEQDPLLAPGGPERLPVDKRSEEPQAPRAILATEVRDQVLEALRGRLVRAGYEPSDASRLSYSAAVTALGWRDIIAPSALNSFYLFYAVTEVRDPEKTVTSAEAERLRIAARALIKYLNDNPGED